MARTLATGWLSLCVGACGGSSGDSEDGTGPAPDWLFVAVEGDGTLAVIDATTGELVRAVDLTQSVHGMLVRYDVHNAQGSADGRTVWATVMPAMEEGEGHGMAMADSLVGVDVESMTVQSRIDLGEDLHVAHVVLDGSTAYVTAYEADAVLVVDLDAGSVVATHALPEGTAPHGARLTPDGKTLVVAGMGDGAIDLLDTTSGAVDTFPLPGRAVQTAVLPDGSAAFATIYDTRQLARLDLGTRQIALFDLPAGSAGPVQIYPTADGRHVWVADQGLLDGRAAGTRLLRIETTTGATDLEAVVSGGPHGVVVSADGKRVWTTTIVEGTVESIEAETGERVTKAHVGTQPNGITCVHHAGAMP